VPLTGFASPVWVRSQSGVARLCMSALVAPVVTAGEARSPTSIEVPVHVTGISRAPVLGSSPSVNSMSPVYPAEPMVLKCLSPVSRATHSVSRSLTGPPSHLCVRGAELSGNGWTPTTPARTGSNLRNRVILDNPALRGEQC